MSAFRRLEERLARLEAAQFSGEPAPVTPQPEPARAPEPTAFDRDLERARERQVARAIREASVGTPDLKWPPSPERPPISQAPLETNESYRRPIAPLTESARAFARRVREQFAGEDWEAIVGGSWLNKLGVLVLVIGISLFLAHSLTHHGPLARVATGLAVSLAMLAGGVVLERRARYVIVSRGLIGGGWAALYTTAYAAHAFESARVIQSPLLASLVLCAVALGMILHSLR
ncbi:DUF2339 domain-containing protein, partial [Candidatus Binatus sp.]|uniref:DUF2339 domain-containing protein n=1 Tax=Candidatus Binatus sp. TaxID=2811406 RepID=UPI003CC5B796